MSKAEDVISNMLLKGFILGKDVVSKAKSFDEKIGLTKKVTTGPPWSTKKSKRSTRSFRFLHRPSQHMQPLLHE